MYFLFQANQCIVKKMYITSKNLGNIKKGTDCIFQIIKGKPLTKKKV